MREKIWLHFLVDAFPIDEDKNVMAEKLSSIDGLSGSDISNCMLRTALHIAESGRHASYSDFFSYAEKILELKKKTADEFSITTKRVSEQYVQEKIGLRKEQK